ncbi:DUF1992 domain-containing protein [Halalkalibacter akibai]|uniref:DnaJ homologue subfamily C member 28 conserved domain-containing protein n=1 Tax=Halalkalibacter akibai (strain ATCC 43226 / DSM 21942 / CIP 109018 / JCM 9157 / 1139) TaxID=1236973 RepID=W4QPK5_HALA3|nr:DUF1992 domain-containing protein [Halalkalibacter akibai]GAE33991.1 hypothetical protein JCM9157_1021 [Halalkalibacter akibai JCM 9157]
MDIIAMIAEDKIKAAIEKGELDNLPGQGKPLVFKDDYPGMSNDMKMAFRMMKNAGFIDDKTAVHKELLNVNDLIRLCDDNRVKTEEEKKASVKEQLFDDVMKKRRGKEELNFGKYAQKIYQKLKSSK